MSNIDKMTTNEQLFADLTPEEGSAVSGGFTTYFVGNKSGIGVNYQITYINPFGKQIQKKEYVAPNKEDVFYSLNAPLVSFDAKIGPGIKYSAESLTPGKSSFDRVGDLLVLGTNIVPNINKL